MAYDPDGNSIGSDIPGDVPFKAGQANAPDTLKAINDSLAKGAPGSTGLPTTPAAPAGPVMPEGIDPRLAEVYTKAGMTPGGDGSGFADWKYWQNNAVNNAGGDWDYVTKRLASDLAGTGTDQPTGTPGQGAWSGSGAADRASGALHQGGGMLGQMLGSRVPPPQMGYGPNSTNGGSFWEGRSPSEFASASQSVGGSPLQTQSNGLLQQLIGRLQLGGNGLKFPIQT